MLWGCAQLYAAGMCAAICCRAVRSYMLQGCAQLYAVRMRAAICCKPVCSYMLQGDVQLYAVSVCVQLEAAELIATLQPRVVYFNHFDVYIFLKY